MGRKFRMPVLVGLFGAGFGLAGQTEAAEKKELGTGGERYLALYLSTESHKNLQAQLVKLGIGATHTAGHRVILRSRMTERDDYIYQPLYGERAAFRLKGVVKSEDSGVLVGVGRVAAIAGEIKEGDFEASLTLYPNDVASAALSIDERGAMDLPTRLQLANVVRGKQVWKGRISSQTVLGRSYPAEKASFTGFAFADQVVVDGHICSSDHVDDEGACNFDRAGLSESGEPPAASEEENNSTDSSSSSRSSDSSSDSSPAKERECPVCQYMKGGPCKAQFLEWDACVQGMSEDDDLSVCFQPTLKMMECMRKYEYYDMMTANSESKMAQVNAPKEDSNQ